MKIAARVKHSSDSGFTLVELMIVIVIIGILSSIAIPLFTTSTEKAKATEAKTRISGILSSAHAEYQSNKSIADVNQSLSNNSSGMLIQASTGGIFDYDASAITDAILTITATAKTLANGGDGKIANKVIFGCVNLESGQTDISKNLLIAESTADVSCD